MEFTLSSRYPWQCDWYDSRTGEVVYKTNIHYNLLGPTTVTLDRVLPAAYSSKGQDDQGKLQSTRVSTIEFHTLSSNIISIGGKDVPTSELLHRKGGWKNLFEGHRHMIGPDGTEYKWQISLTKPELHLADSSNALVAKYHRPHSNFFSSSKKPKPASLELLPHHNELKSASGKDEGYDQETIELILTAFIYLEKKRADQEASRNASAGASAGAVAAAV